MTNVITFLLHFYYILALTRIEKYDNQMNRINFVIFDRGGVFCRLRNSDKKGLIRLIISRRNFRTEKAKGNSFCQVTNVITFLLQFYYNLYLHSSYK